MRRTLILGFATLALAAALLAGITLVGRDGAEANQCATSCYASHSQCRLATKGAASCDSQLSACLARCGRK